MAGAGGLGRCAKAEAFLSGSIAGVGIVLFLKWFMSCRNTTERAENETTTLKTDTKPRKVGILLDPVYGFRCVLTKGIVYPPWSEDQEEAIERLRASDWLRDSDIVIATYPKAGTTLMQQIVMLLLNDGRVERVGDVMVTSPWIEREYCLAKDRNAALEIIRKGRTPGTSNRLVLKTHAPFHLFPAGRIPNRCKIIVVVRDPRDVAVSMHKHYLGLPRFQYKGPLDHFVNLFLAGKVGHGCFFDHVSGWWDAYKQYGSKNILWLRYEEIISDKINVVQKVAEFLGVSGDDDLYHRVMAGSDIDAMRSNAARRSSKQNNFGSVTHFDKGVSGRWKTKLTVSEAEGFKFLYERKLRGKSMDLTFDI